MARINSTQLVHNATSLSTRAYQVKEDPAVQKAWTTAGNDAVRAVQSVAAATFETRAAWRRTAPGGGATYASYQA